MYSDIIRPLLKKMQVLPEELVVMYLMKVAGLTENFARQQVYSACRDRSAYKKDGYLLISPYLPIDSDAKKMAKAFRIIIHFLPESKEYVKSTSPWLLAFAKGNKLVQVCYIENGMEFVMSKMIAERPVPAEDRDSIKRLAIVESTANLHKIKAAGFAYYCTVGEDYALKIISKCKPEEAWADVAEQ